MARQRASAWLRAAGVPTGCAAASDVTVGTQPPFVWLTFQSSNRQSRVPTEPSSASRMIPAAVHSGRPTSDSAWVTYSSASHAFSRSHQCAIPWGELSGQNAWLAELEVTHAESLVGRPEWTAAGDRKSTRLNSSH